MGGIPADDSLKDLIQETLAGFGLDHWGAADLAGIAEADGPGGAAWPGAVSFYTVMDPGIMAGIAQGPTPAYARLYQEKNRLLDQASQALAAALAQAGHAAWPVPSSIRSDPARIRGDFPHKTAATLAGLGWVGRNCQLITRAHGPWVRLGTVLTDAPLAWDRPRDTSGCTRCRRCVEACPAGALTGRAWSPGLPREAILDAAACDQYKKTHFMDLNQGHNCGICTAACPLGR